MSTRSGRERTNRHIVVVALVAFGAGCGLTAILLGGNDGRTAAVSDTDAAHEEAGGGARSTALDRQPRVRSAVAVEGALRSPDPATRSVELEAPPSLRARLARMGQMTPEDAAIATNAIARNLREDSALRDELLDILRTETDRGVLTQLVPLLQRVVLTPVTEPRIAELEQLATSSSPPERRRAAAWAWVQMLLTAPPANVSSSLARKLVDGTIPVEALEPALTAAEELQIGRDPGVRAALEDRIATLPPGPGLEQLAEILLRGVHAQARLDWIYSRWEAAAPERRQSLVAAFVRGGMAPFGNRLPRAPAEGATGAEPARSLDRLARMYEGTQSVETRSGLASRAATMLGLPRGTWAPWLRRLATLEADATQRERLERAASRVEAGSTNPQVVFAVLTGRAE